MGRLIDADELLRRWDELPNRSRIEFDQVIMLMPIAYDVDKVVEQLENERKFWENAYDSNLEKEKARSYEHAIEIVKAGGIVSNQDNMDARR